MKVLVLFGVDWREGREQGARGECGGDGCGVEFEIERSFVAGQKAAVLMGGLTMV